MRMAILSDIHGNLAALEAVLAEARRLGVDVVHSLGDIVGYGPDPGACLDLARSAVTVSLIGNHDAALIGATDTKDFNEFARLALEWTAAVVTAEEKAYLAGLPYTCAGSDCRFVHASPCEPARWHYIQGLHDAPEHFGHFEERICFVGHTHRPFIIVRDLAGCLVEGGQGERLRDGCRYLVNAGSVGQPRDRDPRACFTIFDAGSGAISSHRVDYDVRQTQERMRAAKLPAFLIDRLAVGM